MHRNLKKQVQPALHPIYFKGGNISTPMWARTPNLKNPVFLDNVCQFSIRLKKLIHVMKVNLCRLGRGGGGGRLGDINSRHNLYVKTEGLCMVTPIYHDDVD